MILNYETIISQQLLDIKRFYRCAALLDDQECDRAMLIAVN
jgi:hypothetical protein